MINTYCFDTNCLSHYYEKNENNLMRKKVRSLLAKLASEKARIILPAPVLAEILVGFQTLEGIQYC
jgi:predicted nucleic acid-binding protein